MQSWDAASGYDLRARLLLPFGSTITSVLQAGKREEQEEKVVFLPVSKSSPKSLPQG